MSFEIRKLSEVAEIIMGQSPDGNSYNINGIGLPLLNGAADYKGKVFNPKKFTSSPSKIAIKGDILLGIRATIGNLSISDKDYCIGRGLAAIRIDETKINREFLIHFLSEQISKLINEASGSTIKGIVKEDLFEMQISLPPLATQKRIADILDAADSLRQKDQGILKKYDELAQAIFIEMFGDPVKNEKGWKKKIAVDYYQVRGRVGWKGYKKTDLRQSGALVIGATHVTNRGEIDLTNAVYLSDEKFNESPEITIEKDDLIFVQRGNTIGKVALVRHHLGKATINPVVLILRPVNANPFFLLHLLLNKEQNREFTNSNSGSAQPMITQEFMRNSLLIDVPIAVQENFSKKINLLESQKEKSKVSCEASSGLFNSLLQKAFKGELVK